MPLCGRVRAVAKTLDEGRDGAGVIDQRRHLVHFRIGCVHEDIFVLHRALVTDIGVHRLDGETCHLPDGHGAAAREGDVLEGIVHADGDDRRVLVERADRSDHLIPVLHENLLTFLHVSDKLRHILDRSGHLGNGAEIAADERELAQLVKRARILICLVLCSVFRVRQSIAPEGIGQRVVRAAVDRDEIGVGDRLLRLHTHALQSGNRSCSALFRRQIQLIEAQLLRHGGSQKIERQNVQLGVRIQKPVDVDGAVSAVGTVVVGRAADGLADQIGIAALNAGAVEHSGLRNRIGIQTVAGGDAVAEHGVGVKVLHIRGKSADGKQTEEHHDREQHGKQTLCCIVHVGFSFSIIDKMKRYACLGISCAIISRNPTRNNSHFYKFCLILKSF